jgi:arylformamidase
MVVNKLNIGGFFDITRTIAPKMLVYPRDPRPTFEPYQTIADDRVNVTRISLGSHTGTHVDAQHHFLADGKGVEKEPLSKFIGEAIVIDVSTNEVRNINEANLMRHSNIVSENDIVLIYTGSGRQSMNFSYLDVSAAEWIIKHKIKCVGIDTLSVEEYGNKDAPVHKQLLSKDIGIIENLDDGLKRFVNKRMFLVCLPLPLKGIDGAPARAILFEIIK